MQAAEQKVSFKIDVFLSPGHIEACLLGRLLVLTQQGVPLRRLPLLLPLAGSLGASTLGVHLLLDLLLASLLGLGTVDLFLVSVIASSVAAGDSATKPRGADPT